MKKQEDSPCDEAGQTLLEVLLAFSVSILVLGAIILGITTSLSNTQYTKNQGLANSYAQEGMAVIRQKRDSDWNYFNAMAGSYCLAGDLALTSLLNLNCGQNVGFFSRQINIGTANTSDCVGINPTLTAAETLSVRQSIGKKVTVAVYWSDNKCPAGTSNPYCHKVEIITCLSNIDQKQTL